SPDAFECLPGESAEGVALRRLDELRALLERHAHEVCALIIEPLVQCAGGMRMYHARYLSGLRALCDQFDVHLIADEIAVGFGRTGTLFACEQAPPPNTGAAAGITPDFLCLSKGLTGGFMPLAAVLTTQCVYEAFYAEYNAGKAFLHSHSYAGNPLACRAALATLDIFR
ncbi:Aminotransferase class-III, partial [mine drainage metagenome]